MQTITRIQIRTRWPEPFGPAFRTQRELARLAPATDATRHDFLVLNPRPDLLEPEPLARFHPYPIDLP